MKKGKRLACNVLIKGNILRFLCAFRNNGWFQKVFTQYTSTFLKLYENETARKLSWPFIFHLYMEKGVSCRGEGHGTQPDGGRAQATFQGICLISWSL